MKPYIGLALVLAAGLVSPRQSEGLTIYRIGGQHLDPPEQCSEPNVDCVQLAFEEVADEARFGRLELLETDGGVLRPMRLDPKVSQTPLVRGREHGQVRAIDHYGLLEDPQLDLLMDGDVDTAYQGIEQQYTSGCNWTGVGENIRDGFSRACKPMWIKLGGLFYIEKLVLQPTPEFFNERFIPALLVGTNDAPPERTQTTLDLDPKHGTRGGVAGRQRAGSDQFVDFDVIHDIRENTTSLLELDMPDEAISEIVITGPSLTNWEIAELEIFGNGAAAVANFQTQPIPIGCGEADRLDCVPEFPSALGELSWAGEVPADATLDLTVRAGDDDDPNSYWRWTFRGNERTPLNEQGRLLRRGEYDALESGERAGINPDHDNWEFWVPPLDFMQGQADLVSEKPRKFVQFRGDFASHVRGGAGARLDFLQFSVSSPPVATSVVAEIAPARVNLGETTTFRYRLKPVVGQDDVGFDSIEISTPAAPESVDSLYIGTRALGPGQFDCWPVDEAGRCYDAERSSFVVRLPEDARVDLDLSFEVITVVFQSQVFRVGTVFAGRVFDSTRPLEVRQRVTAGDADPLADSNTLTVQPEQVGMKTIQALRVSPFTPNGDGINDVLALEFVLVNVGDGVPVSVEVFALNGQRVAVVPVAATGSGRFPAQWTGRDESGDLVPPGLYLVRLEVASDRESQAAVAAVPVVY